MMALDFHSWVVVFGAALLFTAAPGPSSFYVPTRTLIGGLSEGLASSLGIAVGGLLHVAAGAIGVSALVLASPNAFLVLKLAGATYLVWLGVRTIRSASGEVTTVTVRGSGIRKAFRDGIVVEALNPKTAAFFLAFIPGFVEPGRSFALQFVTFGLSAICAGVLVDVVVTLTVASARSALVERPKWIRRARVGSGVIICLLGAMLVFVHRPM